MKQNKVIGLTGSIATGKSSATNIIKSLGYPVIDADLIARDIVKDEKVIKEIKSFFGEDIYNQGDLNRDRLGKIIFESLEKREVLNNITHPAIYNEIKKRIKEEKSGIIFLDIPLLIETLQSIKEYKLDLDEIWLVYIPKETQVTRLMLRDNISREYAEEKISSQISVEDKKKYADIVLNNLTNLEDLEKNIKDEIEKLKNR